MTWPKAEGICRAQQVFSSPSQPLRAGADQVNALCTANCTALLPTMGAPVPGQKLPWCRSSTYC